MFTARLGREIIVRTEREIGLLWDISRTLSEKGIDILAAGVCAEGRETAVRVVTDDNLRAIDALNRKKLAPKESGVVVTEVPHQPGMLMKLADKLMREAIEIDHLYASAPGNQATCLVVFSSSDNDRAVIALDKAAVAIGAR